MDEPTSASTLERFNALTIKNDVFRRGIKHRAAPDRFAKRFAEMTEPRVSDFRRGFGHVVASGAQQLGRAFHPHIAQILRNGKAHFARKDSAEIKRTAAHFLPQHFQRRRIRQIACEQFFGPLHAFSRDAFLPHAEKFRILGREKKMLHEFERLALIPKNLSCFRHWWFVQTRDDSTLLDCHRSRRRNHALVLSPKDDPANLRLQIRFTLHKLLLQMFTRKFESHELMMITRSPRRREQFVADRVIAAISRRIIAVHFPADSDLAMALQIQTKLKAARMERTSPVKRTLGAKVVPLHRNAYLIDIAVKRAPSAFHLTPSVLFGRATGIHVA